VAELVPAAMRDVSWRRQRRNQDTPHCGWKYRVA